MTATYHCGKCQRKFGMGNFAQVGMKNTCCRKCSNPSCIDHGICDCLQAFMDANRERMKKDFIRFYLGKKDSGGVE